jgi:N,N'-diacetyllegionaminate synthase
VSRAVELLAAEGNRDVIIQYGFQGCPTRIEDVNLRYLATLKQTFGVPFSYGDHTDGADEMAITLPVVAVAMGANVIEKHLTYDRSVKGEDFESALDPESFRRFTHAIRTTKKAFGSANWKPLSQ